MPAAVLPQGLSLLLFGPQFPSLKSDSVGHMIFTGLSNPIIPGS